MAETVAAAAAAASRTALPWLVGSMKLLRMDRGPLRAAPINGTTHDQPRDSRRVPSLDNEKWEIWDLGAGMRRLERGEKD